MPIIFTSNDDSRMPCSTGPIVGKHALMTATLTSTQLQTSVPANCPASNQHSSLEGTSRIERLTSNVYPFETRNQKEVESKATRHYHTGFVSLYFLSCLQRVSPTILPSKTCPRQQPWICETFAAPIHFSSAGTESPRPLVYSVMNCQ